SSRRSRKLIGTQIRPLLGTANSSSSSRAELWLTTATRSPSPLPSSSSPACHARIRRPNSAYVVSATGSAGCCGSSTTAVRWPKPNSPRSRKSAMVKGTRTSNASSQLAVGAPTPPHVARVRSNKIRPSSRMGGQISTHAAEVLGGGELGAVLGADPFDAQTMVTAEAGVGARDDHDPVTFSNEDAAGCPAVAALRDRSADDPQPLALVVGERVRVRVGLRAHQAVDVLRGPGPVDPAVLDRALVEEARFGPILRDEVAAAGRDEVERFADHRLDQVHGAVEQVRRGVPRADVDRLLH